MSEEQTSSLVWQSRFLQFGCAIQSKCFFLPTFCKRGHKAIGFEFLDWLRRSSWIQCTCHLLHTCHNSTLKSSPNLRGAEHLALIFHAHKFRSIVVFENKRNMNVNSTSRETV
uniref:Uncharacterized protein n=1 Tax=Pyxicephalus adspersus TaxID=30357 RepID=A0AAV3A4M7_PYXAD|nr:TPA: hypothetical protein GDO54_015194 [Pyxicephalus adspersus]